jgi:hypothetical protein
LNNIQVCLHIITMNPLKMGVPNLLFSTIMFSFFHKMSQMPMPWNSFIWMFIHD